MTAASNVRNFQSIITLIVFVITNAIVVFPFHLPIPLPTALINATFRLLSALRIIKPRRIRGKPLSNGKLPSSLPGADDADGRVEPNGNPTTETMANGTENKKEHSPTASPGTWTVLRFPINFATGPVIAVLFLLACTAIHRKEVHDGILGSDGIVPISIMAFFLALAYIAISLDQTGLIRWLSVWVLKKGGDNGRRLYFYLYSFYISLATLFGNDPVILSATPFIAYMTTASVNIKDPRAWIYAQFAAANVASAILVSSNPTNLVLSGAFDISYVTYTANMIVPVAFTVIVLFPFLLYFVFRSEELVPHSIHMHALPGEVPTPGTAAAGPEIPGVTANGTIDLHALAEQGNAHHPHPPHTSEPLSITLTRARTGLSTHSSAHPPHGHGHGPRRRRTIQNDADEMNLAELLDPHLDRPAAIFCVVLFVITLAVLLATNAAGAKVQVYAITVPAAAVMLARDMVDDWILGRREGDDESDVEAAVVNEKKGMAAAKDPYRRDTYQSTGPMTHEPESIDDEKEGAEGSSNARARTNATAATVTTVAGNGTTMTEGGETLGPMSMASLPHQGQTQNSMVPLLPPGSTPTPKHTTAPPAPTKPSSSPTSLESLLMRLLAAISATFPRASKVISQLPFPLLPFTFGMFILVQGLVTKGWVEIFANGWEQWVRRTGTLGAIGGMGCISVLLCNFAGTNIGATIVLSRVLQQWLSNHNPSERTRDASIYALALGVNYGAFSLTFSASLAGLLWRDILGRKGIHVRAVDFARYNNPLIWCSMVVGCAVLVGQVYIVKAG